MADNTELDAGSGGNKLADAQLTWSGDTAQVQVIANGILSGSEGSWTYTLFTGGAGAVTAGTPRVTLASNDPAVVALQLLDNAVDGNYLNVNANIAGTDMVGGAGAVAAGVQRVTLASNDPGVVHLATIAGDTTSLDTKVTACNTGAVVITTLPSDTFVVEAGALGKGVLLQGDDGTDRHNVAVDGGGHLDVVNTTACIAEGGALGVGVLLQGDDGTDRKNVAVDATTGYIQTDVATLPSTTFVAEGGALGLGVLLQGDDGTDRHNVAVDASGFLRVDLAEQSDGTALVVQENGAALTALQLIDNAIYLDDADWTDSTSSHMLVGGVYQSTLQTVTDGDVAPIQVDVGGCVILGTSAKAIGKLAANTGVDIGDVDVTSIVPGVAATNLGKAEDAAHSSGDVGVMALTVRQNTAAALGATDADYQPLVTDANGRLHVLDANSAAALTALQLIDNPVAVLGTATYAEATTSGNIVGAVRNDDLATLADTDNEIAPLQVDANGALFATLLGMINQAGISKIKTAHGVVAGGAPATDTILAAVASKKIVIHAIALFATSATINTVYVANGDFPLFFNSGNPLAMSLDADGDTVPGFVLPFNIGGWAKTDTANELIAITSTAAQDIAWQLTYSEVD